MKIGLIGSINRDTVHLADKTVKRGWGGMLYNLVTLSHLIGKRAEIFPVCHIGRDSWGEINAILRQLPGVRTDYVHRVPEKNNHCHLTYLPDGEKTEVLEGGVRPLRYDDVAALLDSDIILVNYISGRDIHLKSLQKLRRNYSGPILMDIHSSTLGKRKNGTRFFRRPPHWEEMVIAADYLQMNRRELAILNGRPEWPLSAEMKLEDEARFIYRRLQSVRRTIKDRSLIITAGIDGCYIITAGARGLTIEHIPPVRRVKGGDATGCGDCFSAGMAAALVRGKGLRDAAEQGNRAAYGRITGHIIYELLQSN
ncbi:putative PfkB protein [Candidatus Zixiibacteriota bacterium]|nr:putative PfkB protein [candidate division Zixibacteria bacterium]